MKQCILHVNQLHLASKRLKSRCGYEWVRKKRGIENRCRSIRVFAQNNLSNTLDYWHSRDFQAKQPRQWQWQWRVICK